jgi:hypothetical protein
MVSWRQHESNLTRQTEWMDECSAQVRRWYAADVTSRAIADDLFRTGRRLVDEGDPRGAREAFRRSLWHGLADVASSTNLRALVWVSILSLPTRARVGLGRGMTRASRALAGQQRRRDPWLS